MNRFIFFLALILIAVFISSCCSDTDTSRQNEELQKRDSLFKSWINASEGFPVSDTLLDSLYFVVERFGFVDKIGKKAGINQTIPRVLLEGRNTNSDTSVFYRAEIRFFHDTVQLESPRRDNSADSSILFVQYHQSRLEEILEMLNEQEEVVFAYKSRKVSGKWVVLQYCK